MAVKSAGAAPALAPRRDTVTVCGVLLTPVRLTVTSLVGDDPGAGDRCDCSSVTRGTRKGYRLRKEEYNMVGGTFSCDIRLLVSSEEPTERV